MSFYIVGKEDFSRNGYYIVTPSDKVLSECEFIPCEKQPKLGDLQMKVGGYIECISLETSPKTVGVVDEEGKLKSKPRNGLATILAGGETDFIVGTMLVMCGKAVLK